MQMSTCSKYSWLFGWMILSILAHLAHLAQSFFSDFQRNQYINCPWFDLTNQKIYSDWKQKLGKKWSMLPTFFLRAIAAITCILCGILGQMRLMIKKTCRLWSTGGLQESIAWCYLPNANNYDFLTFCAFHSLFFFWQAKKANQGLKSFLEIINDLNKNLRDMVDPSLT